VPGEAVYTGTFVNNKHFFELFCTLFCPSFVLTFLTG
jgi:hypothetical protein